MDEKLTNGWKRIKRITVLTIKKAMDPYFTGNSAEVAFFLLMSIVPTILLLAEILNIFDLSIDIIRQIIDEYANENLAKILLPLLEDHNSSGALSILLILLALWAGSKAIFSLMRISNYAYQGGSSAKNPLLGFIKERVRAVVTIFIIIFTLIFAISILLFGKLIVEAITTYLNDYMGGSFNVDNIWLSFRWVLGFILYFLMVASIYYLLPSSAYKYAQLLSRDHKWKSVKRVIGAWLRNSKNTLRVIFPGSIFSAVGMMVATWGYTLYLNQVSTSKFNILYGSLGAAVLLLLWFYILAYVLVLGIQINSIWDESKQSADKPDKYGGHNV